MLPFTAPREDAVQGIFQPLYLADEDKIAPQAFYGALEIEYGQTTRQASLYQLGVGQFSEVVRNVLPRAGFSYPIVVDAPAIDLIDGPGLCDLLKDYRLGVEMVEVIRPKPEFFERL